MLVPNSHACREKMQNPRKEVVFSIERLTDEISPIRWSRCAGRSAVFFYYSFSPGFRFGNLSSHVCWHVGWFCSLAKFPTYQVSNISMFLAKFGSTMFCSWHVCLQLVATMPRVVELDVSIGLRSLFDV